jgi:hypothetical protein
MNGARTASVYGGSLLPDSVTIERSFWSWFPGDATHFLPPPQLPHGKLIGSLAVCLRTVYEKTERRTRLHGKYDLTKTHPTVWIDRDEGGAALTVEHSAIERTHLLE